MVTFEIQVVPEAEFAMTAAELVRAVISETGALGEPAKICFPTGDTPKQVYAQLRSMAEAGQLSFTHVHGFSLDEWGELPDHHPIRCISRLREGLFDPVGIPTDQVHFLEPNAKRLQQMCEQYDEYIRRTGGLDLSILGIGMNGHVGFNEPGSTPSSRTRVVELDGVTLQVSKRYQLERTPTWGVTVGIATLMESRQVLILANGAHKAEVVKRVVHGPVTEQMPVTFFKEHQNCTFLLDEPAASCL